MKGQVRITSSSSRRERVIALHCSGAGASQWQSLAQALDQGFEVLTPEHFGSKSRGPWTGEHAFTLADEAFTTLSLIDETSGSVHLVGHSYGGGVALKAALSRPDRVASMVLYEPGAFHLLRQMPEKGAAAHAEIASLARNVGEGLLSGDYRGAVAGFVDYWNGPGAWRTMRPALQQALLKWVPKGPLDFQASFNEPTPPSAYRVIDCPVLILRGEHSPRASCVVAECLAELLPNSKLAVVPGAGHMGPISHAEEVSALTIQHISQSRLSTPSTGADVSLLQTLRPDYF
jgi:pimeloyl-ACP methyl ester carboxylesterase